MFRDKRKRRKGLRRLTCVTHAGKRRSRGYGKSRRNRSSVTRSQKRARGVRS